MIGKSEAEDADLPSLRAGLNSIHSDTGQLDEAAQDLSDGMAIERSEPAILGKFRAEEDPQALWTRGSLLAALRTALKEIDMLNEKLDESDRGLKRATSDADKAAVKLSSAVTRSLDLQKEMAELNALRLSNWEKRKSQSAELKTERQRRKELEKQNRKLKEMVGRIRKSISWRLTAPLRLVGRFRRS